MARSRVALLSTLLTDLFGSSARLAAFVRSLAGLERICDDLPSDRVPMAEMASAVAQQLEEHGLCDHDIFLELSRIRPRRSETIRRVAAACGVALSPGPNPPRAPTATSTRASPVPVFSAVLLALVCVPCAGPRERSAGETRDVIPLTPEDGDSLVVNVVSHRTGQRWRVSLSPHLQADLAAHEIFFNLHLAHEAAARGLFEREQFALCEGPRCYASETVGAVIEPNATVHVLQREAHRGGRKPRTPDAALPW